MARTTLHNALFQQLKIVYCPNIIFPFICEALGILNGEQDQDCSLKNREPDVPARLSWFPDPGGWNKTTSVGLYFIFPGICTLSLNVPSLGPSVKIHEPIMDISYFNHQLTLFVLQAVSTEIV
ncbi:hypothetical protein STEG23_000034, partial [Scotinomys teguina]